MRRMTYALEIRTAHSVDVGYTYRRKSNAIKRARELQRTGRYGTVAVLRFRPGNTNLLRPDERLEVAP